MYISVVRVQSSSHVQRPAPYAMRPCPKLCKQGICVTVTPSPSSIMSSRLQTMYEYICSTSNGTYMNLPGIYEYRYIPGTRTGIHCMETEGVRPREDAELYILRCLLVCSRSPPNMPNQVWKLIFPKSSIKHKIHDFLTVVYPISIRPVPCRQPADLPAWPLCALRRRTSPYQPPLAQRRCPWIWASRA